jgi:hypothetical protein
MQMMYGSLLIHMTQLYNTSFSFSGGESDAAHFRQSSTAPTTNIEGTANLPYSKRGPRFQYNLLVKICKISRLKTEVTGSFWLIMLVFRIEIPSINASLTVIVQNAPTVCACLQFRAGTHAL